MSRIEKPNEVEATLQRQKQLSIVEQHDIELHELIDELLAENTHLHQMLRSFLNHPIWEPPTP